MVTGTLPFRGNTSGTIFEAILNREPVALVRLNPEIPEGLEAIINKALEKDRNLRYQGAAELRTDFERLRRGRTSVEQLHVHEQHKGRSRVYFWAGAAALLAAF